MSEKPICAECSMFLRDVAEFHPYAACEVYKYTQSAQDTRNFLRENYPTKADRHVGTGRLLDPREELGNG